MSRWPWTWLLVVLPLVGLGCTTWDETETDDDDDDCAAADDDAADDDAADDDAADDDDDAADDDDDAADDDDDAADDDTGDDDDTVGTDGDGDGFTVAAGDCNDANATIYPGAPEACDGLDNDCDTVVPADEIDGDLDGYAPCAGDCDDLDLYVNPSQAEIPNDGIDNDCDGSVDPTWLPISASPDPSGDHGGYLIDISMHEYSQQGSQLRFKTSSHQVFSDLSVMIDMYVSNGADTYTLTYDSGNPDPDPLQLWSDTNSWAAPLASPASLSVDYDAADTIIMGIDMADLGLGGADEMDVWVGVDLGLGGSYSDQFPDASSATVPLGAAAVLTVDDVQFFEVSGNGDLYIDPNELWHVEVHLENIGDLPTHGVTGTLNSTTDVSVVVDSSTWGTILPGDIDTGTPWFRVGIEPTASSVETLTLDLTGTGGDTSVNVDIPIGWGFPDPTYLRYEYTYWVSGSTAWGDMTVTILDSGQNEVCDHVLEFDADYTYGTGQGTWWPDEADETLEFTNITDPGTGSCPAGYHDLYNVSPSELLLTTNTVLAFISCDVASSAFHGDDVITYTGTGSQVSWCQDVGPSEAAAFGTGDAEAISLMIMSYGALSGIGTFNYYPSADGNYDWGHLGLLMKDAANFTDPVYGMWGDYLQIVHWVFII